MTELVVLQHLEREGAGLLAEVAFARGWSVRLCRLDRGEPPPLELGPDQVLVVLGGPMGVGDIGDPRWPWLAAEVELLRRGLERQQPLLGICLGAQLLAHAGGGGAEPMTLGTPPVPIRELGFGAVTLLRSAAEEPVLAGLERSELVLHWHGDRLRLPPGAVPLAASLVCPEQMFRLGPQAFGLQFHLEVTADSLEHWILEDRDFVCRALGPDGPDRLRAEARRWLQACRPIWCRWLDNLLAALEPSLEP